MVIGLLTLELAVYESFSLKDKRRVVKSVKERIKNRFNVSIAEVGLLELHNRAELAAAMVGSDAGYVEGGLQQVLNFVGADGRCSIESSRIELL